MKKIRIIVLLLICVFFITSCKKNCKKELEKEEIDFSFKLNEEKDGYILTNLENTSLTIVTIPDTYKNLPVTEIKQDCFKNNQLITKVILGKNIKVIANGSFEKCTSLETIVLNENLTTIRTTAFKECFHLTEIYNLSKIKLTIGESINGGIARYAKVIHNSLDVESKIETKNDFRVITIDNYTYLLNYLGNSKTLDLKSLDMNNIIISEAAFYNNYQIEEIILSSKVKEIKDYAFYNCENLRKVKTEDGLTSIGEYSFADCYNLIYLNIPSTVTNISKLAFIDTYKLVEVLNESNIKFTSENIKRERKQGEQSNIVEENEYILYLDGNDSILLDYVGTDNVIELPKEIKGYKYQLSDALFINRDDLKAIMLPNTIKHIGKRTFENCEKLEEIILSNELETIGSNAFYNCVKLTTITLPETLRQIDEYAFTYCYRLVEVVNESNLIIDYQKTTNGSVGLYALTIHNYMGDYQYLFYIDKFLFYGDLTSTYLVDYKGDEKEIILPYQDFTVSYYINTAAFYKNTTLEKVYLPKNVISIQEFAFAGCTNLQEINIPLNVIRIQPYAFYECSNLSKVDFESKSWRNETTFTDIDLLLLEDKSKAAQILRENYTSQFKKTK